MADDGEERVFDDDRAGLDPEEAGEGRVLDPEELDVADDERVERLSENRYVVAADDSGPDVDGGASAPEPDRDAVPDPADGSPELDGEAVAEWLADSFAGNGFQYGFDATVKFDGDVDRHRMVSNDVVATFETLMLWYGRQASGDTDVADALGLLLAESEVPVRVPASALRAACKRHGLSPDDSVADLVALADEEDGFVLGTR